MSGLDQGAESRRRAEDQLARLLGTEPRHAGQDGFPDEDGFQNSSGALEDDDWSDSDVGPVVRPELTAARTTRSADTGGVIRRFWEERFGGWAFGPPQLVVIVVIVLLGLGLVGWSVLRARPVALASGTGVGGSAAPTPAVTEGAQSASTPSSPHAPAPPTAETTTPSPTSSSAAPVIKVHVLGAVKHPGVVTLAVGARVQDALDRAGGVTKAADLGDLNLAQPIADGQQIYIAHDGGQSQVRDPVTVPAGGGAVSPGSDPTAATGSGSSGATAGSAAAPVNLNTATVDELDELPGVGPVTAQKIIDWRAQHGRFDSTEQLQEVDGIGPKTYADLASMVTV
ncbi:hypothetical protein GCM10011575_21240 [Microlunatus endophyticus]|uniref:Helix-hairpin-helix DNA-binding motif class 1 domain-containing protein n=1 Tax=Microlunatus endophyticus TaxID=1716077 RepID=A0A917S7P2_9ACTN|nr:helix-hairpin-helix domain-containing protein [Microlunatus endophyticus]GGL62452.1 hypothetical protein GCM10011575_21240 [Microlunatus endophyticus]